MKNFYCIATGLDVVPLGLELARRPELWNRHTVRTFHERSAHRTLDDIVLRYNRFDPGDDFVDHVCSRIDVVNYPAYAELPLARALVQWLMQRVAGEHLGRVFISRIRPGGSIAPHTDRIAPAEEAFPDRVPPAVYYERHHIVLSSAPGTIFQCGEEQIHMEPGSCWWFNNLEVHSVFNHSSADRVHLVVDIHSFEQSYQPKSLPQGMVN